MKRLLALLLLAAFSVTLFAQESEELTTTVRKLTVKGGASDALAGTLTEAIQAVLISAGKFKVKDRETIESELANMEKATQKKMEYGSEGCNNLSCLQEMAGALQITYLFYGTLTRIGSRYTISLNILSMREGERGTIIDTAQQEATEDGLMLAAKLSVIEMIAKIRVQGLIEYKDGKSAYINLGSKNKIERDSQFEVYRIKVIKLSGGRTFNEKTRIGKLKVLQPEETASKCEIVDGADQVQQNDVILLVENIDKKIADMKKKMEEDMRRVDEEKRKEQDRKREDEERKRQDEERRRQSSGSSSYRSSGSYMEDNGFRFGLGIFVPSDVDYFGKLFPANFQFNFAWFGTTLFSYYFDMTFLFNNTVDRSDLTTTERIDYASHPEFRVMGTNIAKSTIFMGNYAGGMRMNINLWSINLYGFGGVKVYTMHETVKLFSKPYADDLGNWYMGLGWEAGAGLGYALDKELLVYAEAKYGSILPIPIFNMGEGLDKNGSTVYYDPDGVTISIGAAVLFD
ncbi:MAG: hypothetical protein HZC28_12335 [Spirochaetes bacterium]|nr:hypothetical protein [Spirochaetota bacterium]